MKAKLLRNLGLKLVILPDGQPAWMLPALELSASTGEAMTIEQLKAMLDDDSNGTKAMQKLKLKVENRLVPPAPAEPEKNIP